MNTETKTAVLPQVRCEPSLKLRLERIASDSVSNNLADHIRFALVRYVETEETKRENQPELSL